MSRLPEAVTAARWIARAHSCQASTPKAGMDVISERVQAKRASISSLLSDATNRLRVGVVICGQDVGAQRDERLGAAAERLAAAVRARR